MADLYQQEFSLLSSFIKGDGGILEIKAGDQVVWTNRENRGVKPTNEEAIAAMKHFIERQ